MCVARREDFGAILGYSGSTPESSRSHLVTPRNPIKYADFQQVSSRYQRAKRALKGKKSQSGVSLELREKEGELGEKVLSWT